MKVLWICNVLPGIIAEKMGEQVVFGGWLDSIIKQLVENGNELEVLFPSEKVSKSWKEESISVIPFSETDHNLQGKIEARLSIFQPDIIHIHGTEFTHSYYAVAAAKSLGMDNRCVISIQGLVSIICDHFLDGVSEHIKYSFTLKEILRHNSLVNIKNKFVTRGKSEIKCLKLARYVIGRTDWDRACVWEINPDATYFGVNETLRDTFYNTDWNYEKCEKYSIYANCGDTPLKGLHYMVRSLKILKEKYPQVKLYLTMRDPFKQNWFARSSYMRAMCKYINENNLRESIEFLGFINKNEMAILLSKVNVFALPSNIENSPNSMGEAMLVGVPCVAADVGGVKNMMEHQKEGFVYQGNAPYMMAFYIGEIFDNSSMAISIGQNAKLHAKKTHSERENYEQLISVYQLIREAALNEK